jgi:hypothetical protein
MNECRGSIGCEAVRSFGLRFADHAGSLWSAARVDSLSVAIHCVRGPYEGAHFVTPGVGGASSRLISGGLRCGSLVPGRAGRQGVRPPMPPPRGGEDRLLCTDVGVGAVGSQGEVDLAVEEGDDRARRVDAPHAVRGDVHRDGCAAGRAGRLRRSAGVAEPSRRRLGRRGRRAGRRGPGAGRPR